MPLAKNLIERVEKNNVRRREGDMQMNLDCGYIVK